MCILCLAAEPHYCAPYGSAAVGGPLRQGMHLVLPTFLALQQHQPQPHVPAATAITLPGRVRQGRAASAGISHLLRLQGCHAAHTSRTHGTLG